VKTWDHGFNGVRALRQHLGSDSGFRDAYLVYRLRSNAHRTLHIGLFTHLETQSILLYRFLAKPVRHSHVHETHGDLIH
jgi:hypothetical protein